jgi:membrane-bound lytic murein transglycosylase D
MLISSTQAYGQSAGQALVPPNNSDAQTVINRAEAAFLLGEKSFARGNHEEARKFFDEALDIVITSGISLKEDAKLNAYYRRLLERIHKHEAQPGDLHEDEDEIEIVEPAVLDEVADVKDDELAMTTPEGIKIYGKYDFDFSVAPPVFQFLSYFVTGRGRSTMEVGLQRSGRYREMAERIFK